jgi:hypothetical protein
MAYRPLSERVRDRTLALNPPEPAQLTTESPTDSPAPAPDRGSHVPAAQSPSRPNPAFSKPEPTAQVAPRPNPAFSKPESPRYGRPPAAAPKPPKISAAVMRQLRNLKRPGQ